MSTDLDLDDVAATSDKAKKELAALRAEVERLREALRVLYDASIAPRDAAHGAAWQSALRQAKAALEGSSDES